MIYFIPTFQALQLHLHCFVGTIDSVIAQHNGKRKGVKLGTDGVNVIDAFRERTEVSEASPKVKKKLGSVRIWRDDRPLLDEIFNHLGLDESLNQSQKMGELLAWVKGRLDNQSNLSEPESNVEANSATDLPSQSQRGKLELDTTTPDNEPPQSTATVSLPSVPNPYATPQTLSASNLTSSSLETKIEQLVDVMTRFIDLQMKDALPSPSPPPPKVKVKAPTEVKPTTASGAAPEAALTENTTQQRSKRNSPEAEAAINAAINAIIAHNNSTELHDLKWAISINAVKDKVSEVTKSQRLVERAIKERFDEIEAHHAQHQIEPNHNHRHKRKRTIAQTIPLPSVPPPPPASQ